MKMNAVRIFFVVLFLLSIGLLTQGCTSKFKCGTTTTKCGGVPSGECEVTNFGTDCEGCKLTTYETGTWTNCKDQNDNAGTQADCKGANCGVCGVVIMQNVTNCGATIDIFDCDGKDCNYA